MRASRQLYDQAIKLGLCSKWQGDWNGESVESLCSMYKRGIQFCIENDYPSVEFMVDKFRGKTEKHGLYISERFSIKAEQDVYILNGNCNGKVENNGWGVTKIYVRHNSVLNLVVRGNSMTYIDMYDNTSLDLTILDKAQVTINKYGGIIHGDTDKAKIKLHIQEN
jgi:hypothetical protein